MMDVLSPPFLLRALDRVFKPDPGTRMTGEEQVKHEVAKASDTMLAYLKEIGVERAREMDVLDFGCGWGGESIALAQWVRSVCGVDVDCESVDTARDALGASNIKNCRFEWSIDGRLPFADNSFDAVFSTDTFEHVMDLDLAFREINRVLKPGGSLISKWGPLFHSPNGYHLYWACKVPWAHLLFGVHAIGIMRTLRGGSKAVPDTWQDLGLNARRFDDYRKAIRGFDIVRFRAIPVMGQTWLTKIPFVRDLFIFGIDCHITKRVAQTARPPADR